MIEGKGRREGKGKGNLKGKIKVRGGGKKGGEGERDREGEGEGEWSKGGAMAAQFPPLRTRRTPDSYWFTLARRTKMRMAQTYAR